LRGLHLFVRPIEATDSDVVAGFLARHRGGDTHSGVVRTATGLGLVGKLLGDLVAVVTLELTPDAIRIHDVVVASHLRGKRIGRAMLREVETLAIKMDRRRIVVEEAGDAEGFFRRVGFIEEDRRWVRGLS
jgi:ribosomal protein S18 acetylase RimI-like enzyme